MSSFYIAAHALILNSSNQLLVLKRSLQNDYMPLKWDLPGGTVELGETVEEALKRELKEEANISIEVMRPLYVYTNLSQIPERQTVQIVFLCNFLGGEIHLNPEEHDAYKWIDYNEIFSLECIAYLDNFVHQFSSLNSIL